jgi:LPXTG-motif cell wall-anchored protein
VDPDTNVLSPAQGKTLEYLDGAEFVLVDSDGTTEIPVLYNTEGQYYYPKASEAETAVNIVSVKNGTGVVIRGLDNQTYYLKEVTAPTGYNPLTELVELTVEQDTTGNKQIVIDEKSKVKIANNAGTVLPSTGGMGTTLFYVIGSILVIGAGVLLVVRRRMNDR